MLWFVLKAFEHAIHSFIIVIFHISYRSFRLHADINYKMKLITSTDDWVESCSPNPCQHGGKCIASGKKQICQCVGHFTGRFCGLTMCELDPCVFGQCELTGIGFKVEKLYSCGRIIIINYLWTVSLSNGLFGHDMWSKAEAMQW
jgi:hypothetical protein